MSREIEISLDNHIRNKGIAISAIALKTGVSDSILYSSLRGSRKLRSDELILVCDFLGLEPMKICKTQSTA